jgi:hypothetical protein
MLPFGSTHALKLPVPVEEATHGALRRMMWLLQVEMVTYKWPSWLHKQTEKQRIIWAYKILFLDVLFPLDVKRIIFCDSDQIIRTDLVRSLAAHRAPMMHVP